MLTAVDHNIPTSCPTPPFKTIERSALHYSSTQTLNKSNTTHPRPVISSFCSTRCKVLDSYSRDVVSTMGGGLDICGATMADTQMVMPCGMEASGLAGWVIVAQRGDVCLTGKKCFSLRGGARLYDAGRKDGVIEVL
jgi:hypothetical protein